MKGDCVEDEGAPIFMWGTPAELGLKDLRAGSIIRYETEAERSAIEQTLAERGSRYGNFKEQGRIEQNIKRAFADSANWDNLPADSKSALEMIATKISRILKGDPEYADSWHDIIGYAKLIEDRINNGG